MASSLCHLFYLPCASSPPPCRGWALGCAGAVWGAARARWAPHAPPAPALPSTAQDLSCASLSLLSRAVAVPAVEVSVIYCPSVVNLPWPGCGCHAVCGDRQGLGTGTARVCPSACPALLCVCVSVHGAATDPEEGAKFGWLHYSQTFSLAWIWCFNSCFLG